MTYTLMCVKYKSYLNREMRSLWTADAFEIADPNYYSETGIRNFNFGDGIITTQVINHNVEDKDYAVLMDETTNIISRWYIIECKYSRYNQYELTLMRDLLFDYQEEIANSTVYIENAMLNRYNPLIYSKEPGVTVNQILTDRVPLKDATGIPWVVGYVKKSHSVAETTITRDSYLEDACYDYANKSITDWKFASLSTARKFRCTSFTLDMNLTPTFAMNDSRYLRSAGGNWTEAPKSASRDTIVATLNKNNFQKIIREFVDPNVNGIKERLTTGLAEITNANMTELDSLDGRVIKFTEGYYRLELIPDTLSDTNIEANLATDYIVGNLRAINPSANISTVGYGCIKYGVNWTAYRVELSAVPTANIKYKIASTGSRLHTVDSTYDVVCAPYGKWTFNGVELNDPEASLAVMQNMATDNLNVEDVQILPYCPLDLGASHTMASTDEGVKYDWITDLNNTELGVILYCSYSSVKKRVDDTNLSNKFYLQAETEAIPFKTQVQCDFIRLTNGSSMYEMGIAQNEGIRGFSIAMTCLPINPYIHIIPDFGGIYGHTYEKDERGLILGGNFSVAQMSDAWKNYQTQNKNFEAIFDRQTASIDIQNKWANITDVTGAIVGAIQGAGAGAIAGSGIPGNAGAIVGGATGLVASGVMGAIDVYASREIREDNYNARLDIHNLELGNIQALPQTLTRQTSFNVDSMYFPVLEYYTCRSEEMEAFRKKILWDGMTVGVIGNINDYEGYIKCRLIRCPSIGDYHTVQAINEELKKGVYR